MYLSTQPRLSKAVYQAVVTTLASSRRAKDIIIQDHSITRVAEIRPISTCFVRQRTLPSGGFRVFYSGGFHKGY